MKIILCDMSPVFYSNLISASSEVKRNGQKADLLTKKLEYNYEDIVIYKIIEEVAQLKTKFKADELVLAFDNSKGGYWRKDVYSGYKNKRAKGRQESDIDWNSAFNTFDKLKKIFNTSTSYKTVDVERVEGDDIIFVLSKYLSNQGKNVLIHSLDHDLIQCLKYTNVEYYRTRKSQKKDGEYQFATPEEIQELELEHCIVGDPGDGFGHIKQWSKFSKEFTDEYPHFLNQELKLWPKRFEIDTKFEDKTGFKAYKHPRYGWKTFKKSFGLHNFNILLNENEIYKLNHQCNKNLAMQDEIPQSITDNIINDYNNAPNEKNIGDLQKFFISNNLFELTHTVAFL